MYVRKLDRLETTLIPAQQAGAEKSLASRLLRNNLASFYFTQPGSGLLYERLSDCFDNLKGHAIINRIDGLQNDEIIMGAAIEIRRFLTDLKSLNLPENIAQARDNLLSLEYTSPAGARDVVRNFFELANGYIDLGRLCDPLIANYAAGKEGKALQVLEPVYLVLRAGQALSEEKLTAAGAPIMAQPLLRTDIKPAAADIKAKVSPKIRNTIRPIINSAPNNFQRMLDFFLGTEYHPAVVNSIETAIHAFNRLTREEIETQGVAVIEQLKKRSKVIEKTVINPRNGNSVDKLFLSRELYTRTIGQIDSIIQAMVNEDVKNAKNQAALTQCFLEMLVLIKYSGLIRMRI